MDVDSSQKTLVSQGVALILAAYGLEGEHFQDTPLRFAKMFASFNQPHDLAAILSVGFEETRDNVLVVQTDIPFKGLCAHHLLPFQGTAAVGYIAQGRIVGLSKLARVVQAAGECRPSTQEDITNRIVDAIHDTLRPLATGVVTTATHGCMGVRGVSAPQTRTTVSALRGQFLLNPTARLEFLEMTKR
jgi:GTP cyclohydrolase I